MAEILFTHSYFYKFDQKQWRTKQPYPPLGTIQAAAYLRKNGFDVDLFDTNLRDDPREIGPYLQSNPPKYLVIYDDGFNYLSKMCLTKMRDAAMVMAKEGKEAGCIVMISSSDATDHYEKYLNHDADYIIRGEGEQTLLELILALKSNTDESTVQGLALIKNQNIIVTPNRSVKQNLDEFPLAAWDLVDISSYEKIWREHHKYFSINLATTRGCPFKCNWCAKPIYGNRYNSRSPRHVVEEIKLLLGRYNPDHFWMADDIFGLKPGWVQEFRDLVVESKLKFRYKIQSRVDLLLQEDTVDALKQSGAETVWVGAESGSQKILNDMDKGTTVEQIYAATRLLQQKGIKVGFFLQFGYLGETQKDIDATIKMLLDLMPDEAGISVSYPLPGTKFYDKVRDQLEEKQNWTDSADLAMMFHGTFHGDYYRMLHQYVHSLYRSRRGIKMFEKLWHTPLQITSKDLKSGLASFYFTARSFTLNKKLSKLRQPT
ncbi:MAG TPA: radical SAM protein [Cyclobacteriaceae bacterium]|nr:radical SAM protein [Cyclobacteriaceae bacterium]